MNRPVETIRVVQRHHDGSVSVHDFEGSEVLEGMDHDLTDGTVGLRLINVKSVEVVYKDML